MKSRTHCLVLATLSSLNLLVNGFARNLKGRSKRCLVTSLSYQSESDSMGIAGLDYRGKGMKRKQRQVYKHLFRHYADISFDSWLRCQDPREFLLSVGYKDNEIDRLERDYPKLLSLDVHDQLAPKVRFLVETMGGGTGSLAWSEVGDSRSELNIDDECEFAEGSEHAAHSLHLADEAKQAVPGEYFGCQLDRSFGPLHAYLVYHGLLHGKKLLADSMLFKLFLQSSKIDDFCELCQEWETNPMKKHTSKDIEGFVSYFASGLIGAAKDSSPLISLLLRHGANPFEYDSKGILPLHWAGGTDNLQGFLALLDAEEGDCLVDILDNIREPKEGATPFHWACCGVSKEFFGEGGSFNICQKMLQESKDRRSDLANSQTWISKSTPLMWASWGGSLRIVDLLVIHGADVSHTNVKGETAFHWAAAAGNLDVLSYLFSNCARGREMLTLADHSGKTPLNHARDFRHEDSVNWINEAVFSKEVLKKFISA